MSDLTRNARNGVEHGCIVPCALPSMYHMLLNVRDSLHGCRRLVGPQLCMQLFEVVHRDTVTVIVLLESPICHAFERKSDSEGCKAGPGATDFLLMIGLPCLFRKWFPFRSCCRGPPQLITSSQVLSFPHLLLICSARLRHPFCQCACPAAVLSAIPLSEVIFQKLSWKEVSMVTGPSTGTP